MKEDPNAPPSPWPASTRWEITGQLGGSDWEEDVQAGTEAELATICALWYKRGVRWIRLRNSTRSHSGEYGPRIGILWYDQERERAFEAEILQAAAKVLLRRGWRPPPGGDSEEE